MDKALCLITLLFLAGCESAPPETSKAAGSTATGAFAQPPRDRPGLGTKWGEDSQSRVSIRDFKRASNSPSVTETIYYNDARGIAVMTHGAPLRREAFEILEDDPAISLSLGIQGGEGRFLPATERLGKHYIVGKEGERYRIVFRNQNERRVEAVLSVDGLDVIDGQRASLPKRGYVVRPHQKLVVEGFRRSMETVAAFRFGPVRESYANEKYHRTGNVGVIGLAVFEEAASGDSRLEKEAQRRQKARPFATPAY